MARLRALSLVRRVYALVRGVGRKRLVVAVVMVVAQGVAQVVGVTSIFPFLQIATDPAGFRGSRLAAWLPVAGWSDRELLLGSGLTCIGLLFTSNMISLAAIVTRAQYVQGVATHLRKRLVRDVLAQPYSFFLETNSSEVYQRVQVEVQQFAAQILMPLLNLCASGLTVGLLLTTITVAQPLAALVAVAGVVVFYAAIFWFVRPRARRVGEDVRAHSKAMIRTLQEVLGSVKTVLAFDKARFFAGRYARASDAMASRMPWVQVYGAFPKFFLEPLGLGGLVALMVAAALSEGAFAQALPSLGVLALSAYRLLPEAQKLYAQATSATTYGHVVAKVERRGFAMHALPSAEGEVRALPFEDDISFEDVSFTYPGASSPVMQHVRATIPKNAAVGIAGPSGSGKSTFVDLLLGLHQPTGGSVRIDGVPLTDANLKAWRQLAAYVPQEVPLFDDTLSANIAFGVAPEDVDRRLLREVAAAAQLLEFVERELPRGFETVVGERGARLSGGQRQRVGLARALYRRPEVLILDEATSALDSATEGMVMQALRDLHGTLTMVVIAHRTDTLKMCDLRLEFPLAPRVQTGVED
ncbi:MAG: ABC transporter ATP-binding protein [Planctomycetota bacterium]